MFVRLNEKENVMDGNLQIHLKNYQKLRKQLKRFNLKIKNLFDLEVIDYEKKENVFLRNIRIIKDLKTPHFIDFYFQCVSVVQDKLEVLKVL